MFNSFNTSSGINKNIYGLNNQSLVINLDSTVGISGTTWTDQTGNGYNYTFYDNSNNIGITNNGVNVNTVTINSFTAVFLDGSGNFLWRNNTNGFGSNIFTSSFTYEMWVYPISKNNATLIYENGQNGFSGWSDDQMGLNSSGYITSYVYQGTAIGNSNSSSVYSINKWYQIVNVYDNTANKLYQYVNGVLSAQVTVTRTPPTSTKVWLLVGSNTGNSSSFMSGLGYFCGCIGAFRGYNIALSSSQILQNYYSYKLTRYTIDNSSFNTTVTQSSGFTKTTNNPPYTFYTFNVSNAGTGSGTTATYTFNVVGTPIRANYLIVGGGGVGGNVSNGSIGGGGGAGGYLLGSIGLNIGSYTITVGQGATRSASGSSSSIVGPAGAVTVSLTAYCGGPGGISDSAPTSINVGSGGGGGITGSNSVAGANGTTGQGYNGGSSSYSKTGVAIYQYYICGGGGGGAGGAGYNGVSNSFITSSVTGGAAVQINSSNLPGYNSTLYICGGGGGCNLYSGGTPPSGNTMKGGSFSTNSCGGDGAVVGYASNNKSAGNGTTYGSGGGGGGGTGYLAGYGYQGVVIITYSNT
jgi:hypothetical protein